MNGKIIFSTIFSFFHPGVDEVVEAFETDLGTDGSVKVASELLFSKFHHRPLSLVVASRLPRSGLDVASTFGGSFGYEHFVRAVCLFAGTVNHVP